MEPETRDASPASYASHGLLGALSGTQGGRRLGEATPTLTIQEGQFAKGAGGCYYSMELLLRCGKKINYYSWIYRKGIIECKYSSMALSSLLCWITERRSLSVVKVSHLGRLRGPSTVPFAIPCSAANPAMFPQAQEFKSHTRLLSLINSMMKVTRHPPIPPFQESGAGQIIAGSAFYYLGSSTEGTVELQ